MTTRAELRDLAARVLRAADTLAGDNIQTPSVMPTHPRDMPVLFVQTPLERKVALPGRALPRFDTSITLAVVGRISHASEDFLQLVADQLVDQLHAAVLGSPDMQRVVQEFTEVETSVALTGEGSTPLAEIVVHFHCQVRQSYEPPLGEPLLTIDMQLQRNGQTVGAARLDLPQI